MNSEVKNLQTVVSSLIEVDKKQNANIQYLNTTIKDMDVAVIGGANKVLTTISQTDGVISASAIDLTTANIKRTATSKLSGTTVQAALLQLANKEVGSSLTSAYLSAEQLYLEYKLESGEKNTIKVNLSTFLSEAEFKDGLLVNNKGEVSIKIDTTSEGAEQYITVSSDGLKISGIDNAIKTETDRAIAVEKYISGVVSSLHNYDDTKIKADVNYVSGVVSSLHNYDDTQLRTILTGFSTTSTVSSVLDESIKQSSERDMAIVKELTGLIVSTYALSADVTSLYNDVNTNKINRVIPATSGNLVSLTASGSLIDTGKALGGATISSWIDSTTSAKVYEKNINKIATQAAVVTNVENQIIDFDDQFANLSSSISYLLEQVDLKEPDGSSTPVTNKINTTIAPLVTLQDGETILRDGHYQMTLNANATIYAEIGEANKVGSAQIFINPGTYTLTAGGNNLTIVNSLTASKVNHCTISWFGTSARLYVIDSW